MKTLFAIMILIGLTITVTSGQEVVQTEHPNITETVLEGELQKRIYHFPSTVSFSLTLKGEEIELLEGFDKEADITFLLAGEYVMIYRVDNANSLIDFFEIKE